MRRRHLAAAVLSATAVLGVGGIAAAQSDDDGTSTTVTTPDATSDTTSDSSSDATVDDSSDATVDVPSAIDDATAPEGCDGGGRGPGGAAPGSLNEAPSDAPVESSAGSALSA